MMYLTHVSLEFSGYGVNRKIFLDFFFRGDIVVRLYLEKVSSRPAHPTWSLRSNVRTDGARPAWARNFLDAVPNRGAVPDLDSVFEHVHNLNPLEVEIALNDFTSHADRLGKLAFSAVPHFEPNELLVPARLNRLGLGKAKQRVILPTHHTCARLVREVKALPFESSILAARQLVYGVPPPLFVDYSAPEV